MGNCGTARDASGKTQKYGGGLFFDVGNVVIPLSALSASRQEVDFSQCLRTRTSSRRSPSASGSSPPCTLVWAVERDVRVRGGECPAGGDHAEKAAAAAAVLPGGVLYDATAAPIAAAAAGITPGGTAPYVNSRTLSARRT